MCSETNRNDEAEITLKASDFRALIREMAVLKRLTPRKLGQAVNDWLTQKRAEQKAPKSLRYYKDNIQPFIDFAGPESDTSDITREQVRQYLALSQQRPGPFAHNARYKALRNFLRFCEAEGFIQENPLRMQQPKLPQRVKPMFSDTELVAMLKEADQNSTALRDRAILLTFIDTGMRLRELTDMAMDQVDWGSHRVTVYGKGAKERELYLSQKTVNAILKYVRHRDSGENRIWLSEEGRPLTDHGVQQIVERISKRALGRVSGPHKFRHTFASNFLLNGGQEGELQRLLGHTSLRIVQGYVEATKNMRALQAHKRFSPVERLLG